MIEARHLVKRYGSTLAVSDLSFSIRPGIASALLGDPAALIFDEPVNGRPGVRDDRSSR
jgi:ABC-type multidrug transport system ATPase subunit